MRQVRLVILAGIGILVLSGVAVIASLLDYVNHPGVAVAHVPPVVGPGAPDATPPAAVQEAAPPLPATPVTSVPVQPAQGADQASQQQSVAAANGRQSDTLARLIQELQQRRKRPPH